MRTEGAETHPVADRYAGLRLSILGSVAVWIHKDQREVISSTLHRSAMTLVTPGLALWSTRVKVLISTFPSCFSLHGKS